MYYDYEKEFVVSVRRGSDAVGVFLGVFGGE